MKDYRASRKWIRWILSAITVIVLFLHAGLLLSSTLKNSRVAALFALLLFSLLLLNFFVWRAIGHVFEKLSLLQEEALRKLQMEHIVRLSRQTRDHEEKILRIHHDLKNHLGVLYSLLRDGQVGQAGDYVNRIRAFLEEGRAPK